MKNFVQELEKLGFKEINGDPERGLTTRLPDKDPHLAQQKVIEALGDEAYISRFEAVGEHILVVRPARFAPRAAEEVKEPNGATE